MNDRVYKRRLHVFIDVLTMTQPVVTFTYRALAQLYHIVNKSNTYGVLRLGLKSGGCVGFQYVLEPIATSTPLRTTDEIIKPSEGLEIRVDGSSLIWLIGTHVDWVEGAMGSYFTFKNPNAGVECGCGVSFAAADVT